VIASLQFLRTYISCLLVNEWSGSVWHSVAPIYLSDFCISATAVSGRQNLRFISSRTLLVSHVRSAVGQRSFAVTGPTIWNTLPPALRAPETRAVTERFHTCTEAAPVLDHPAPLRRLLRDSGAKYKYADLLPYLPVV